MNFSPQIYKLYTLKHAIYQSIKKYSETSYVDFIYNIILKVVV